MHVVDAVAEPGGDLGNSLLASRYQQPEPVRVAGFGVGAVEDSGEELLAERRVRVPGGHDDGFMPLIQVSAGDERLDVGVVSRLGGGEVFLDSAVNEVDPAGDRFADHSATEQQVLQERGRACR